MFNMSCKCMWLALWIISLSSGSTCGPCSRSSSSNLMLCLSTSSWGEGGSQYYHELCTNTKSCKQACKYQPTNIPPPPYHTSTPTHTHLRMLVRPHSGELERTMSITVVILVKGSKSPNLLLCCTV